MKEKTLGQGKLWGSWLGLPAWAEPVVTAVPALIPSFCLALHKCAGRYWITAIAFIFISVL